MTTFIISAVCAAALNTAAISAPADTVDTYLVNGRKIENFNGSQLENKVVTRYSIARAKGRAERVHIISAKGTDEINNTIRLSQTPDLDGMSQSAFTITYIVIDGKRASTDELKALAPDKIYSVSVLEGDSAVKTYGEEAKNGAVIVTTKGSRNNITVTQTPVKVVYVLNGKIISKNEFDKLTPAQIKDMKILKGKEQTRKYTDEDCSVILVTTK